MRERFLFRWSARLAAGLPILATQNIEARIPASDKPAKGDHEYLFSAFPENR